MITIHSIKRSRIPHPLNTQAAHHAHEQRVKNTAAALRDWLNEQKAAKNTRIWQE